MPTRPKFIAGNWKMYTSATGATRLAASIAEGLGDDRRAIVAVFPPFPWLAAVAEVLKGTCVLLGAQNCYSEPEGAYTGEVSPAMLRDAGCEYVIVGHSERRHAMREGNEFLNRKLKTALAAGLRVIFCVGEQLAQRQAGTTEAVLDAELDGGLVGVTAEQMARVVLAYEPVWAIGTGVVATPEQAQDTHAFIRRKIAGMYGENVARQLLIQYGGSVKPDNAAALLHLPDVDGALVGGASLTAESFLAIVRAAF